MNAPEIKGYGLITTKFTTPHWGWLVFVVAIFTITVPMGYYVAPTIAALLGIETSLLRLIAAVVYLPTAFLMVCAATRVNIEVEHS